MRRFIFTALFLFLGLSPFPAFGDGLSVLDRVRLNNFRLQAADTSVMLYIGWNHDDSKAFKEAAQEAAREVKQIIRLDEALAPSSELKELVGSQIRVLNKQALLYNGMEAKDETALKAGYEAFNNNLRVFYKNQEDAVEAYEKARHYDEGNLVPLKEELKFSPNPAASKTYQEGVELIRTKKYAPALQKLNPLLKTVKGTAFGACVALRVSDILEMGGDQVTPAPSAKDKVWTDPALDLLTVIEKKAPYSPVAFEAFLKWRTKTQEGFHGMSNFSDIPNYEYNRERERWLVIVREYQKTHPQDAWAEVQAETFLIQPNIERGEAYGNSNLSFTGTLYMDPRYYYDPPKKK